MSWLVVLLAATTSSGSLALIDDKSPLAAIMVRAEPEDAGLERSAVEHLVRAAAKSKTDALIVLRGDRVIVDRRWGKPGPIETMSVTKSVVALAFGLLLAEGKLDSLDAPAHRWFPQWKRGDFARITVRHLLTQTSGLEHESYAAPLYKARDSTKVALSRKLKHAPGEVFSYNNEGTQLLARIAAACAGQPLDRYLDARLFEPLGFGSWTWRKDPAGNVRAFSDLALEPQDLAKLGLLLLHGGKSGERTLLDPGFVAEATRPTPRADQYGLLWWIRRPRPGVAQTPAQLAQIAEAGFIGAETLRAFDYHIFESEAAYWLSAGARLSEVERRELARLARRGVTPFLAVPRPPIGYYGDGWLGQYVLVYPAQRLVVVRMRRSTENNDDAENRRWGFAELFELVEALGEAAPAPSPPAPALELRSRATLSKPAAEALIADLVPRKPGARLVPNFKDRAPHGLRVIAIERGSPHEAIGLAVGDVLRAVEGQPLLDTPHLQDLLAPLLSGRATTLELERRGRPHVLTLELE